MEEPIVRNYGYLLEMQGVRAGYFTRVTGLGMSVAPIEYREGGASTVVRKLPGRTSVSDVLLHHGVTRSREMWDWMETANNGRVERRNVSIILLDVDSITEVVRWNLGNSWIASWILGDLDALGNDVAIETCTLVAETIERAQAG